MRSRPAMRHTISVGLAAALIAGCGDDPKTADPDEVPLVPGAAVVQSFDEPNGIIVATVHYELVTKEGVADSADLAAQQKAFLREQGWTVQVDKTVGPGIWDAKKAEVPDAVRFGSVDAMRARSMGGRARSELTADATARREGIIIQFSPPGPAEPGA